MKRFLLGKSGKALSQSYIWYSLSGVLNAGQSALLLIVLSRTNSTEDAGVFAIAYAIACLALSVGNYGVRGYQVTDVSEKVSFGSFLKARLFSDGLMVIILFFYMLRGRFLFAYSFRKCLVILLLGLLKTIDSIEDVFHGMYQQKGRLDIAGRCMTIRYVSYLVSFSVALVLTHDLAVSAGVALIVNATVFIYSISQTYDEVRLNGKIEYEDGIECKGILREVLFLIRSDSNQMQKVLRECSSLCVGGFLTMYVANAPKYAIDGACSEIQQACFNYIFMPVYVINVLNSFVFQPIINRMAISYERHDKKKFDMYFRRQILLIGGLIALVLLAGYILGIPVLGWLYSVDLIEYKKSFMILLIGSAFLAIQGFLAALITMMRKQIYLLLGYGCSAAVAFFASGRIVISFGVIGEAYLYCVMMAIQAIVFGLIYFIFSRGLEWDKISV